MVVPLYQKISDDLKDEITSKKIAVGEKLPTEMELSDSYHVSRITAKRALNELEQLGLVSRTRGKGSFVKDTTEENPLPLNKVILFILPFGDLSFGNFNQGLVPFCKEAGYTVFITHADYLNETDASVIQQNFSGLIYYPMNTDEYLDKLCMLASLDFPIVVLDKKIHGLQLPCVQSDNAMGGYLATHHLIELGHQKIAFITLDEVHHPHTVRNRYLGYIQALAEAHLPYHTSFTDHEATSKNILEFVKNNEITGLICENDLIAIQCMNALQAANYIIPSDISIVGFDNIQASQLSNPPLSTIEQNFTELGIEAGQSLVNWVEKGEIPSDSKVAVKFIERNTTKELS